MATKKNPLTDEDTLAMPTADADFDQAIDDLRGVLKNDEEGTLPDLGSDFGSDMGSDFGADLDSDFGGAAEMPGFDGGFGGDSFASDTSAFGAASAQTGSHQPGSALNSNLDLIMDIPIDMQVVLGTSRMQVSGLMNLEEGAIIALDKRIGEPVEIMVNGRRIARGEITVLEDDDTRFGVKLIEVMSTKIT
ncbi:MAG: flagellar motor switch protein FliN [Allorhizobium sp.]